MSGEPITITITITRRRILVMLLFIIPLLCSNFFVLIKIGSSPQSVFPTSPHQWGISPIEDPDGSNHNITAAIDDVNSHGVAITKQKMSQRLNCPGENVNVDSSDDTAILILTSWASSSSLSSSSSSASASLPSTEIIDAIINKATSSSMPIFITIDGLPETFYTTNPSIDIFPKIEELEKYAITLFDKYLNDSRIHILPGLEHLTIAGSLIRVLNLIECYYPAVRHVYYLNEGVYDEKSASFMDNVQKMYPTKSIKPYGDYENSAKSLPFQSQQNEGIVDAKTSINQKLPPANTAIIISSSYIPSHPSTKMIETVINSTKYLIGLPPSVPIFITVDGFQQYRYTEQNTSVLLSNIHDLEDYTTTLFQHHLLPSSFSSHRRVHILPALKHLHIAGSVMKALTLIQTHYPSVKYIYYLQHDFSFTTKIDHTALMDISTKLYPDKVNYIRFKFKQREGKLTKCGNETKIIHHLSKLDMRIPLHETTLYPSPTYSDNNHFVKFDWYKKMIGSIGMDNLRRPPEFYLKKMFYDWCDRNMFRGTYFYDSVVLKHLDGRRTVY